MRAGRLRGDRGPLWLLLRWWACPDEAQPEDGADARERGDVRVGLPGLDAAEDAPVDAGRVGNCLLRQVLPEASKPDVLPDLPARMLGGALGRRDGRHPAKIPDG